MTTTPELAAFFDGRDLRGLRARCGFTVRTVAAGVGVSLPIVARWEQGAAVPRGAAGARYARVAAGMARHLEVARDGDEEAAA